MADHVDDFRRVTQRFVRRFGTLSSDSTPCGTPLSTAHAHALMVLLSRGELSQQALGAELCIDKSNVARLCAKMVRAKHVKQRTSDRDGRSRLVSLTAAGTRLAKEVDGASRAHFRALLDVIPASRHADVIHALQDIVAALGSSPPDPLDEGKR